MILKQLKSQTISCCLNYNQIVDEFHKREETKSNLYPSPPNIRGQCGGSFVLSLMVDDTREQGTRESKILGGGGCLFDSRISCT